MSRRRAPADPPPGASNPPPKRSRASRQHQGVFSGARDTMEARNSALVCPVCFDLLCEAQMTPCGHSFCRECLEAALARSPSCPKCGFRLEGPLSACAFPNFALNELAVRMKKEAAAATDSSSERDRGHDLTLEAALARDALCSNLADVDDLITKLTRRRQQLQSESFFAQQFLLRDFLLHLKKQKEGELFKLQRETGVISGDLASVEESISDRLREEEAGRLPFDEEGGGPLVPDTVENERSQQERQQALKRLEGIYQEDFKDQKRRMQTHFNDLTECYFDKRASDMLFPRVEAGKDSPAATSAPSTSSNSPTPSSSSASPTLDSFAKCLSRFTRYNSVRPLSTLNYTADIFNSASIVSSIEFDKDSEFFAIAGVTKRIKIYEYSVILKDLVDIHYPSGEMTCGSKISCVSWNPFQKSCLASSDYEGTVLLWDTAVARKSRVFQEHEKRCWSVDFNSVDTKLLASGSDDARVKLWSTNVAHSVASLEAKANVCCVKFSPTSSYHLAYGSADHCVHYYDLRSTKSPLALYKGHKKAVSYVKFLDSKTIVSASTDSQLKLWNLEDPKAACTRSFLGHINEKNFVGLATDGDFVTCGSENNSLYVYYKGLSNPLFSFKFDGGGHYGGGMQLESPDPQEEAGGSGEFVSAVCWRQGTNVVVGANSQGTIKILELN